MVAALGVGDEVVTAGGILGKVTETSRPVPHRRDRERRAGQGPAPHGHQRAAQGHPEERLSRPGVRACTVIRPGKSGWSPSSCSRARVLALPNVFGEAPALQLSRNDRTAVTDASASRSSRLLQSQGRDGRELVPRGRPPRAALRRRRARACKARDVDPAGAPRASTWWRCPTCRARRAGCARSGLKPMSLGLDLRGGVYFMYEVDAQGAVKQLLTSMESDYRTLLRKERIPFTGVASDGVDTVTDRLAQRRRRADGSPSLLRKQDPNLSVDTDTLGEGGSVTVTLSPTQIKQRQDFAIQQNITTLRNRVDELGVTEPIVARQGLDRIVVQLPGVQDPERGAARARRDGHARVPAGGRPERRRRGRAHQACAARLEALPHARWPAGPAQARHRSSPASSSTDASSGFQEGEPAVMVTLDARGASKMLETTRQNLGRPMAVVFIEKKRVAEGQPCNGVRAGQRVHRGGGHQRRHHPRRVRQQLPDHGRDGQRGA